MGDLQEKIDTASCCEEYTGDCAGPVKKPQMDYMSHRGITHARCGPLCTRRDKKRRCINSSQCTPTKVVAGLDMAAALGVVPSGYGGWSMRKALLFPKQPLGNSSLA